jgi:hypothetical protein
LAGKGASGYVNVQDSTDGTKRIMFNAAGGTTNTRTMLSSTQTVDRTLSLPDATDTLVGKATTDTLTNKTITGGILNGTLGATTPSTVAATTISATGIISSTSNNPSAEFGKGNGTAASVRLNPHTATYYNWSIDNGVTSSGTLNIAPSTAVGGKTYTSPVAIFTTTGLNCTAIGQTTAAAGSFTTLDSTGVIAAGTNARVGVGVNTGQVYFNNTDVGVWRGASNVLTTGAYLNMGGYDGVTVSVGAAAIGSKTKILDVSSTGLAVTGNGSFTATQPTLSLVATGGTNSSNLVFTPAAGYDAIISTSVASKLIFKYNSTEVARIDSGSFAVTGTLSATGLVTLQQTGSNTTDVEYIKFSVGCSRISLR